MQPFFIVGCPRSGTTVFRNYIKACTHLICPEETFYYRWTYPFGTNEFFQSVNSQLCQKHRQIDKVDEKEFQKVLYNVKSRKELLLKHINLMGCQDSNFWFEKTPQHLYSIPLISADFPESNFKHHCIINKIRFKPSLM